jgi:homocysteine S-methyltransferase
MTVPQDVRDRMAAAGSGAKARETGVAIARENLVALRDRVQGAYIMPPLGRYEMAVQILEGFER